MYTLNMHYHDIIDQHTSQMSLPWLEHHGLGVVLVVLAFEAGARVIRAECVHVFPFLLPLCQDHQAIVEYLEFLAFAQFGFSLSSS